MNNFFRYQDTLKNKELYHNVTFFEWIIPIIVLYSLIVLLFVYKNVIMESMHLDLILRITFGVLLGILYVSHYTLLWIYNGFTVDNLPLQLCAISIVLAIILLITSSRKIHAFVLFAGVLGGIVALIVPLVGYSYQYYRYYQFTLSHIILVIVPIYYTVIHQYKPNFKTALRVLVVLEILFFTMTTINTMYDTNYFYVSLSENTITDMQMVNLFGGMPWYVFNVNILGVMVYFLWYNVIKYLYAKKVSHDSFMLSNSVYDKNN